MPVFAPDADRPIESSQPESGDSPKRLEKFGKIWKIAMAKIAKIAKIAIKIIKSWGSWSNREFWARLYKKLQLLKETQAKCLMSGGQYQLIVDL